MKKSKNLLEVVPLPCGASLKNRMVMAPMTTCAGFHDGSVTEDLIDYYRHRAGTLGAIIVECGFVDDKGAAFPGAIGLDSDEKIPGLSKIAAVIKEKGSKAIIQVYHGGRMVESKFIGGLTPVAPSAVAAPRPHAPKPEALSSEEVGQMIIKFGEAVRRAIEAGFDGIEIHGANTYLIQQFYSPNSNQREDEWGGDRDNRLRFPLAVLNTVIDQVDKHASADFIIGYRFSPEEIENPGIRFEDTLYLLEKLSEKQLDYVHFSMGNTLRSSLVNTQNKTPLIDTYIQRRSERLAKIPVIGVGNIVNKQDAEIALSHGYDILAIGRACIAYPDWADRILNGETLELIIPSDAREQRHIPEPLWHFPLVESLIRDTHASLTHLKPGEYQEQVNDESNEFIINVSLSDNAILDLTLFNAEQFDDTVLSHFNQIKNDIVQCQSPHVDAIAGATTQCEAFKKAVTKALSKSHKAALIDKGENPDEKEADVVVIGSGGAGLAAAIQTHDKGANVLIIEKMPIIGGNTNKASAGMNAAETKFQRAKGIKDSKSLFYDETYKGGKCKNNPDLLHYFVDHGAQAINWLEKKGIVLSGLTTTGGMSVKRTHRPENGAAVGGFLVSGLIKNINKRHIEVMLESEVTAISRNEDNTFILTVKSDDGATQKITAKAIVMATGGFGANHAMIEHYRPDLKGFVTTNHAGAMGSGIQLLETLGAGVVDMKEIQIHPTVEQKSSYLISESIRGGGAVLISQSGDRFVNELDTRDMVSSSILQLPEKYAYIIFDAKVKDANKAVEEYLSHHLVVEAPTLSELGGKLSIDKSRLETTLKKYNHAIKNEEKDQFNRSTGRSLLCTAPYYAIQIAPGIHHTMGGITITPNTEVAMKNGQILKGVYAAGEVAGGIHGANRIGGNAVADIVIFGIKAGDEAANFVKHHKK